MKLHLHLRSWQTQAFFELKLFYFIFLLNFEIKIIFIGFIIHLVYAEDELSNIAEISLLSSSLMTLCALPLIIIILKI